MLRNPSPIVRGLLRVPVAAAYWLGAGQGRLALEGRDRIFLCHGTPRHTAGWLARQLRYLRRAYAFVPLADFVAASGTPREPGQKRRAALMFDDGLRSNVTVAYPILRALGIPATFFVCPGLIEERRWLWTHETRCRLRFAAAPLRRALAAQVGAPAEIDPFVEWMKQLDYPRRTQVEAALRKATAGFVPSAAEREEFDLAGWRELRSLDPTIVSIGSHSMTHPILPSLGAAEIEAEVGDSRRLIEAKIGRPAELFSYPNDDFDELTVGAVRRHYRAAILTNSSVAGDPHLLSCMHLPASVLTLAWRVNRDGAPSALPVRRPLPRYGIP